MRQKFETNVVDVARSDLGRNSHSVIGKPPPPAYATYPTFLDGVAALCVQAAALASSQSGAWEEVAYEDA